MKIQKNQNKIQYDTTLKASSSFITIKFRFSGKATKILKTCFDVPEYTSKQMGDFFFKFSGLLTISYYNFNFITNYANVKLESCYWHIS